MQLHTWLATASLQGLQWLPQRLTAALASQQTPAGHLVAAPVAHWLPQALQLLALPASQLPALSHFGIVSMADKSNLSA